MKSCLGWGQIIRAIRGKRIYPYIMKIRLHAVIPITEANGPGKRFGIWTQGCLLKCEGCFNPDTHSLYGGYEIEIDVLFEQINSQNNIEGVSISGGEPLLQTEALEQLLKKIKQNTNLSVLLFSGYTFEQITANQNQKQILKYLDILIAGPFIPKLKTDQPLLASKNQQIYFLTQRYNIFDLPVFDAEIIIKPNGNVIITGIKIQRR